MIDRKKEVEEMLAKAKKLKEEKEKKEKEDKVEKILVVEVIEENPVNLLPQVFKPSQALSLNTDLQETAVSILDRFKIDDEQYSNLNLDEKEIAVVRKAMGKMTTGVSASVPMICRGDACSFKQKCLTGDALVLTEGLKTKPIRDIKVGDKVYSSNSSHILEKRLVKNVSELEPKNVYEIKTESGNSIKATYNHPFKVVEDTGIYWRTLEAGLSVGDRVLVIDNFSDFPFSESIGDFLIDEIVSISFCGIEKVYDITIETNSNFIANNFLVHNCPYFEIGAAPVNKDCLPEVQLAEYMTTKYMEDHKINPNSITEVHILSRLVELSLLERRLTLYMSIHEQDLTTEMVVSVDPEGNEIRNRTSSIAFEQRERLDRSKMKILESLNATRERQAKLQLTAAAVSNQSNSFANIRDMLDELASQIKEKNVVNKDK